MTTINVRVEEKTKKAARKALEGMGLDMSSAINLFLRQVVIYNGLPFTPMTSERAKTIRAKWDKGAAEAIKNGKGYDSAEELFKDLFKRDA